MAAQATTQIQSAVILEAGYPRLSVPGRRAAAAGCGLTFWKALYLPVLGLRSVAKSSGLNDGICGGQDPNQVQSSVQPVSPSCGCPCLRKLSAVAAGVESVADGKQTWVVKADHIARIAHIQHLPRRGPGCLALQRWVPSREAPLERAV